MENGQSAIVQRLNRGSRYERLSIMGQIGVWQIVIIAVVVVLLFGRGKISELMGDVARGIGIQCKMHDPCNDFVPVVYRR